MKHQTCEVCGASLDFGERCDCEKGLYKALNKAQSDIKISSADTPYGMPATAPEKPKVVIDGLNPVIDVISAAFDKPAPMPAFIAEMISGLRAKR